MQESEHPFHIYITVSTDSNLSDVASQFALNGWRQRKCSWTDFEVTSDLGELVIEGHSPVLIHGSLANLGSALQTILEIILGLSRNYAYEVYNADDELILEHAAPLGR